MVEDSTKPGRHLRRRRTGGMPDWLIGMIIAAVIFGILYLFRDQIGIGDDPSFGVLTSGNLPFKG